MRKLTYSMSMSLDGYIKGPDGSFDWAVPDEELHQFHNDQVREVDLHLLGRNLYETMLYWETADQAPDAGPIEIDFARVWQALPKLVFSKTLDSVEGNTKLMKGGLIDEVVRLKSEPGGDIAIGGAGLAAQCIEHGLVDEFLVFVLPVLAGGGTPFFPPLEATSRLRLVETRTFDSPAHYMRYELA